MAQTVGDIMIGRVVTVEETTTVLSAVKIMTTHNIGAVIIMSAIKEPVGIFTERDLLKRVINEEIDPKTIPISKVMTPKFLCVQVTDELNGLAKIMLDGNFRHLPVVQGRKLLGMLSIRDLLRYLSQ